jgi:hypothetical protein
LIFLAPFEITIYKTLHLLTVVVGKNSESMIVMFPPRVRTLTILHTTKLTTTCLATFTRRLQSMHTKTFMMPLPILQLLSSLPYRLGIAWNLRRLVPLRVPMVLAEPHVPSTILIVMVLEHPVAALVPTNTLQDYRVNPYLEGFLLKYL